MAIAAVQRGATFVTLPLFAAALTPAEYGQIAVLLTVYGLATVLIPGGLELPVFRAMFAPDSDSERTDRLANLVTLLFVGPILIGAVLGAIARQLPPLFEMDPDQLALYLLTAGIFVAGTMGPLTIVRAKERFGSYATMVLAYTVVNLFLRVWLVLMQDRGVSGWVLADLGAALFALGLSLVWQRQHLSIGRLRRDHVTDGLRVGLPLLPHQASHWGLTLSDRLVVAAYSTPALVGIYSMASQIALVSGLVVTELSRAFMPRYGEALQRGSDSSDLQSYLRQQAILVLGLCGLAAVLGPQAVHLVLPGSYADGADLIPWLALGSALLGLYYIPMNLLTITHGRTSGIWRYSVAGAGVNVGLNVVLVPRMGLIAAALNTVVGYLVLLGLVARGARRAGATEGINVRGLVRPLALLAGLAGAFAAVAVDPGAVGVAGAVAGAVAVGLVTLVELRRASPDGARTDLGPTGALSA